MASLEKALQICLDAHQGQLDRNGEPYALHPLRVMERVHGSDARIVALLHDVVEKSDYTLKDLGAEGFSSAVVQAVDALTQRDQESYVDQVRRAATSALVREVKLADLADHLDPERIHYHDETGEDDLSRLRRQVRGSLFLRGRMSEEQYLAGADKDEKKPRPAKK